MAFRQDNNSHPVRILILDKTKSTANIPLGGNLVWTILTLQGVIKVLGLFLFWRNGVQEKRAVILSMLRRVAPVTVNSPFLIYLTFEVLWYHQLLVNITTFLWFFFTILWNAPFHLPFKPAACGRDASWTLRPFTHWIRQEIEMQKCEVFTQKSTHTFF